MTEALEFIRVLIEDVILFLGYPGIALVMLAENLFPPIPSELVMPFAGFLAAQGKLDPVIAVIAGTLGALVGAVMLYYIGYWADEPIIRNFIRRFGKFLLLSEEDLDRALDFFAKHGELVVFFGRLIPIIRSLISLPAGMKRMPLIKFLLFTTIGSVIWNTVLTVAGMILGANWDQVLVFMKQYERVVLVLLVIAVIGFVVYKVMQMRNKTALSAEPAND